MTTKILPNCGTCVFLTKTIIHLYYNYLIFIQLFNNNNTTEKKLSESSLDNNTTFSKMIEKLGNFRFNLKVKNTKTKQLYSIQ